MFKKLVTYLILLDALRVISVSEKTGYINRIRDLAKGSGSLWLENQEK